MLSTTSELSTDQLDTRTWGCPPSPRYASLVEKIRPVLADIKKGAAERDSNRILPSPQINELKALGFGAIRVPVDYGGSAVTLPEFFAMIIELGEADSNIAQALRGHFAFVEDLLSFGATPFADRWLTIAGRNETASNAMAEIGPGAMQKSLLTKLIEQDGNFFVTGSKYYSTGAMYADWIEVNAADATDDAVLAMINRHAEGVEIIDDWDGFGQKLTASGTAHFRNVLVAENDLRKHSTRFGHSLPYFQLYHLATLAGIARGIANDTAEFVAKRTRVYSHGAASKSSHDPQLLQVVGAVRGMAYSAGALVMRLAESMENAVNLLRDGDKDAYDRACPLLEIETSQIQSVVIDLVLNAATQAFDAMSASSTKQGLGLDRYWRNARTIASHNPHIYKQRIVGEFAVNGTLPPARWTVGAV